MGATVSTAIVKTTQQAISTITNNSILQTQSSCSQATQVIQNINAGDIVNSDNATIENSANIVGKLYCIQTSDQTDAFKDAIQGNLSADLVSGSSGGTTIGISVSTSVINANSQSIQNVANSFNQKTFQSCIQNTNIGQGITVGNIINSKNVTLDNTAVVNAVGTCTQAQTQLVQAQTDLTNSIATSAKATSSAGVNVGTIIAIIVVVLIVIVAAALGIFRSPHKMIPSPAYTYINSSGNIA